MSGAVPPALAAAVLLHRAGQLAEAAEAYRLVLAESPDNIAALINLGAVCAGLGRDDEAVEALEHAMRIAPDDQDAMVNLANLELRRGRIDPALALYYRALAFAPDFPALRYNLAVALGRAGRREDALAQFAEAVRLRPSYREAHFGLIATLGQLKRNDALCHAVDALLVQAPGDAEALFHCATHLHTAGERERAIALYRRSIEGAPEVAETWGNLAQALADLRRGTEARDAAARAVALKPDFAEGWNTLGNACTVEGDPAGGVEAYRKAVALAPGMAVAWINLAQQLMELGDGAGARAAIERGLALAPKLPSAWNAAGLLALTDHDTEKAIIAFNTALEIDPEFVEASNNLAAAFQERGELDRAIEAYLGLIARHPDVPDPYFNIAGVLQRAGRHGEAANMLRKAVALRPDNAAALILLAHSMLHDCVWDNIDSVLAKALALAEVQPGEARSVEIAPFGLINTPASPALLQKISRQACRRIEHRLAGQRARAEFHHRKPEGRLRVGFVSPDFRVHSVAYAFAGLIEAADRRDFAWHGYSTAQRPMDEMTARLRGRFDRFAEIAALSPLDAAKLINDDGIDILVDLAGHTRGTGLGIFAMRPARLQVHYLGYGATTGASFIDYLITDDWYGQVAFVPYFDEALVYLPRTMMAAAPAVSAPGTARRADHGLPEDALVIANFNAHFKFDPRMWGLWMRLLRAVPHAVLWLIEGSPESEANLRREAEARGVTAGRIIFAPKLAHPLHLQRLPLADFCVDTHHHSGGVTTSDSLRMGVPVVTLPGNKPNGWTSASILAAVGAKELIAQTEDEFEALLRRLATDKGYREGLRSRLIGTAPRASLFDGKRMQRSLEYAYRHMVEIAESGGAPRSFRAPDFPDHHSG
ncbi:MAG: tetratricopeptide repeat protein [Alphaproteobacteria bacterium]|nr:tetratricopeptide repeat protein [Alphaproteobacteria bacterium]